MHIIGFNRAQQLALWKKQKEGEKKASVRFSVIILAVRIWCCRLADLMLVMWPDLQGAHEKMLLLRTSEPCVNLSLYFETLFLIDVPRGSGSQSLEKPSQHS